MTQYIIVRGDLPRGTQAAQIAHAAGSGSERHPPGAYVVVLSASDEPELVSISRQLEALGLPHTLVVESDPPCANQATAIGVELLRDRHVIRKAVSSLPLLGKEAAR